MTREKIDLSDGVRVLSARRRPAEEEHPSAETLAAYHAGGLPAATAEPLRDHLTRCAECADLLLELEGFPELETAGREPRPEPDAEVAAQWRALRQRLRREAEPRPGLIQLEGEGPPRHTGPGPSSTPLPASLRTVSRAPWWLAAAAAGLALLSGLWALDLGQRLRQRDQPRVNVALYHLRPEDDRLRGGAEPESRLPAEAEAALLILYDAPDLTYPDYEVVLRESGAGGRELFRRTGVTPEPRDRFFTVEIPPGYLSAGRYVIELHGLGRGDPRLLATYLLTAGPPTAGPGIGGAG
jgi:hypothetical protein